MEDENDAKDRKIQFSQCRASFQAFKIDLNEGIFDENEARANIVISKLHDDDTVEKLTELPMKLIPPPRPPSPEPVPVLQPVEKCINKPPPSEYFFLFAKTKLIWICKYLND